MALGDLTNTNTNRPAAGTATKSFALPAPTFREEIRANRADQIREFNHFAKEIKKVLAKSDEDKAEVRSLVCFSTLDPRLTRWIPLGCARSPCPAAAGAAHV